MDYKKAANHWVEKDKDNTKMPTEELWSKIESFLVANNTCALATGSGTYVRCTPIEYMYHDGAIWMFSEGGKKFLGLETNKNVSIAIYDKYDGFGNLKGMQIMGLASIIEPFSDEYNHAAECKKIPIDALKKLPEPMNLIKVDILEIDYLNSSFKKNGYSSRQNWTK